MNILAARTANFLVACGAIKQRDISIYQYGLEVLYLSLLEVMSILLLAVCVAVSYTHLTLPTTSRV